MSASVALQNRAAGADEQTAEVPNRQTPKRRGDNAHEVSQRKRTKKSRNLAPSQAITEAAMADVAPAGVERRDKSTESPAKYAGNEDGEKSDEDHRGKMVTNYHKVFLGFRTEGINPCNKY